MAISYHRQCSYIIAIPKKYVQAELPDRFKVTVAYDETLGVVKVNQSFVLKVNQCAYDVETVVAKTC